MLKALNDLQLEKEHLRQIIQLMRRKLYGRKSERIDPNQLNLFPDEEEQKPAVVESENGVESEEKKQGTKRRRKQRTKTGRNPFPDNLPREIHRPMVSAILRTELPRRDREYCVNSSYNTERNRCDFWNSLIQRERSERLGFDVFSWIPIRRT